jgi:enamine deaminase RidA (YjgF/YER057c/UK114 family)
MNFINPETLAPPKGYNHGVLSNGGRILFVAGQIGWDRNAKLVDGFAAQFDLALANVLEVVRAAGGNAQDISRFTIFVKDKSEYLKLRKEIGSLYRQRMGNHYPAMTLVVVKDLLEDGALVEIEATAVIP